ncbi:hypothetical protein [Roseiconus nitratireducens]|uniref:hypothetical protein n=1 Tax=Roseiconus nitratireducens TaxID=2605748 RepID=UPI0013762C26|nr:hypothetical protein [Roseiconus nitratireducens]
MEAIIKPNGNGNRCFSFCGFGLVSFGGWYGFSLKTKSVQTVAMQISKGNANAAI